MTGEMFLEDSAYILFIDRKCRTEGEGLLKVLMNPWREGQNRCGVYKTGFFKLATKLI